MWADNLVAIVKCVWCCALLISPISPICCTLQAWRSAQGCAGVPPAGDPIEVGALAGALAGGAGAGGRRGPPALLSSKACCGHTEATAGLAGDHRLSVLTAPHEPCC